MAQTATVQFNVRIDRQIKEEGDALLERLGISPAQAVRALWARLAALAHKEDADKTVNELLFPLSPVEQEAWEKELARRQAALARMDELSRQAAELIGPDKPFFADMPYKELKELLLMDELEEV